MASFHFYLVLCLDKNTFANIVALRRLNSQMCFVVCGGQAFPHSGLQPLPKRPALEKSNGSSSLFNPSVLHYQQALANAQLQQPAFFPTGKSPQAIHASKQKHSWMCHTCKHTDNTQLTCWHKCPWWYSESHPILLYYCESAPSHTCHSKKMVTS